MTRARRILWLSILSGAGYLAWNRWQQRQAVPAAGPAWPPIDTPAAPSPATTPSATASMPTGTARDDDEQVPAQPAGFAAVATVGDPAVAWVEPHDDGSCPITHPIKANDNSMIFHTPDGTFYQRTRAERCYLDADSATADGYRAAKS